MPRVKVFVDYWNLQLSMNQRETAVSGNPDPKVKIDWRSLGAWLAKKAAEVAGLGVGFAYEGINIYASYNPQTTEGKGLQQVDDNMGKPAAWSPRGMLRETAENATEMSRMPQDYF